MISLKQNEVGEYMRDFNVTFCINKLKT